MISSGHPWRGSRSQRTKNNALVVNGHSVEANERLGTANVFLFTEPLAGWRTIEIAAQRTAIDWAQQIKHLLDGYYPDADKVILVCDNLNTHKIASLYEAFAPRGSKARTTSGVTLHAEARQLVEHR
jgi:DDE superfamily endonuclease